MDIVPDVLNVKLFASGKFPLHVPVPFMTILVVPEHELAVSVKLPPTYKVNPFIIRFVPGVKLPLMFISDPRVNVPFIGALKLLRTTDPILTVHVDPTLKVDPLVTTVPDEYVNPAFIKTVPDRVIVPDVFIFIGLVSIPAPLHVPVPFNTITVVPPTVLLGIFKLPPIVNVLPFIVMLLLVCRYPVAVMLSAKVTVKLPPLKKTLEGQIFVLDVIVETAFIVNNPDPDIVIVLDNLTFPLTVIPFVSVNVFVYPVQSIDAHTALVFNVQATLLASNIAISAFVGTAPVAPPPLVKLQLVEVPQDVPTFLK
jgi:hypothetical protein